MLEDLIKHAQQLPAYNIASWQPVLKGDMDLVITANGHWLHQGTAITNTKIMQLFGRLLQRQSNGDYWIITPVEAFRITVEDLPFVIVAADFVHQKGVGEWHFTSNTGDKIYLSQANQLIVTSDSEHPKPQLLVRDRLWGRIDRAVFYQLALACEVNETTQGNHAQLISGAHRYDFGPV